MPDNQEQKPVWDVSTHGEPTEEQRGQYEVVGETLPTLEQPVADEQVQATGEAKKAEKKSESKSDK